MRGGAQAHLMRCSDNNYYVVKFQNNPQGTRILANEMLATRLAQRIGLPVATPEVVEVDDWLIEHTPDLHIQLAHNTVKCTHGRQFGSRYIADPLLARVIDYMPAEMLDRVRNVEAFAGMLAVDKWAGNADGRQAAFWRKNSERKYTAVFIDQGYCFNAGEWSFPDHPLRGIYSRNEVYASICGWESFEPWLSKIEAFPPDQIRAIAHDIPEEWYGRDQDALDGLIDQLIVRRQLIQGLIEMLRVSTRRPFPCWGTPMKCRSSDETVLWRQCRA